MTLDWTILHWIQDTMRSDFLDLVMTFITRLGSGGVVWILASLVLLLRPGTRRKGMILLFSMLLGFLLGNVLIKNLVCRPRPCWLDPSVSLAISVPRDYSFPSGHTLNSCIGAYGLRKTDRRLGPPAALLAAAIAFSRMYLYVHFPSDIVGGGLIGLLTARYCWRAAYRKEFHYGNEDRS